MNRRRRAGFTLLEMVMAVVIAGLVMGGIYSSLQTARTLTAEQIDRGNSNRQFSIEMNRLRQLLGRAVLVNYDPKDRHLSYLVSYDYRQGDTIFARQESLFFKDYGFERVSRLLSWPDQNSYLGSDFDSLKTEEESFDTVRFENLAGLQVSIDQVYERRSVRNNPSLRQKNIRPAWVSLKAQFHDGTEQSIQKVFEHWFVTGQIE